MDTEKNFRTSTRSRWLAWMLMGLGILLVLFLVFDAGIAIGARRALELHGEHDMGHGGPAPTLGFGSFGVTMPHGYIPDGNGAVGTIQSIHLPTLTIKTRDGSEEEITLGTHTTVESTSSTLSQQDLQVGETIVAIGNPGAATSSQLLAAELIRVLEGPSK